ncbi:hypothetical protein [Streptomyces sp. ODS28]|uniref:effector-associated constant component EACC1 n=1 Tax=Streptomyces sp. ODS28 TaxID=3136688 RepID=UPI0031EAD16E
MGEYVRIAVDSGDRPGEVAAATEVLRRRLARFALRSDGTWEEPRVEPRPGAPGTQGPVSDLLLNFAVDHVAPDAAMLAVQHLVRAVVAHFRAQPDQSQRVTVTAGGTTVELRAEGMPPEEVARLELLIVQGLLDRLEE